MTTPGDKPTPPAEKPKACPICGKPASPADRPFCSPRCVDVDLHRWLGGRYSVPVTNDEDPEDIEHPLRDEHF